MLQPPLHWPMRNEGKINNIWCSAMCHLFSPWMNVDLVPLWLDEWWLGCHLSLPCTLNQFALYVPLLRNVWNSLWYFAFHTYVKEFHELFPPYAWNFFPILESWIISFLGALWCCSSEFLDVKSLVFISWDCFPSFVHDQGEVLFMIDLVRIFALGNLHLEILIQSLKR